jgi:hypothetical protein
MIERFGRRHRLAIAVSALVLVTVANGSSAGAAPGGTSRTSGSPAKHTYGAIVVGVPELNLPGAKHAGSVDVYFPNGRKQRLTEQNLGLVGSKQGDFDRFGAAAVIVRLNDDWYPDLVIGAPGTPARGSKGKVVVLFGSAAGFSGKGAQVLSAVQAGDEFGAAVTVSGRTLFVGAPGLDAGGVPNSGGLYRYSFDSRGAATAIDLLTEASPSLGGVLQESQRFGEVLAAAEDFFSEIDVQVDGVVIGLPNKNVGSATGAGAMIRFHPAATGTGFTAEIWTQNSPGVPGVAERGDHFGAALIRGGYAVGVPGEDVGTAVDAGGVQLFQEDPAQRSYLIPGPSVTQADKKVPGRAEAGDSFGAALATAVFNCRDIRSLAVGSPGEDVGSADGAGSVTFVGLPNEDNVRCAGKLIRQGRGLPGRAEAGDRLGTSLSKINGDSIDEENRFDTLLIGAPGEDVAAGKGYRDTGRASIWKNRPSHSQSFGHQGGDRNGLSYGTVFATEVS